MLFNSFQFAVFFPIVTLLYFLLPHKIRWLHLLIASCIFYMAFVPVYILILIGTIIIDYIAGIMIENSTNRRRKVFLTMSILANVGILAFFKYYNFFAENINDVFSSAHSNYTVPLLTILLPIGLSFHTFQAMSYTIEVYRGHQQAEKHFGIYALYVMFYPQLVAGPIERPQNVLHQFHEKYEFSFDNLKQGLKLMLWGFFKKIVIADRLAIAVNNIYEHPQQHSGAALTIASIFFAFQIYCDFSGYSDIALGTAQVMGFKLMQNFNRPYSAKSISEFWSRWHISLSTWFRDYLYIPLGGNRVSKGRWLMNLMIVFMVSGFWHGASWHYIIWGALHGFYLIFAIISQKYRTAINTKLHIASHKKLNTMLQHISIFVLVTVAWVFFRANTTRDAVFILSHFFSGWHGMLSAGGIKSVLTELGGGDTLSGVFVSCAGLILILFMELVQRQAKDAPIVLNIVAGKSDFIKYGFYYLIILSILLIGVFDNQEFIYFQF